MSTSSTSQVEPRRRPSRIGRRSPGFLGLAVAMLTSCIEVGHEAEVGCFAEPSQPSCKAPGASGSGGKVGVGGSGNLGGSAGEGALGNKGGLGSEGGLGNEGGAAGEATLLAGGAGAGT